MIFPGSLESPAANIILAKVSDPEKAACEAKQAALKMLKSRMDEVTSRMDELGSEVNRPLAEAQIEEFLEWFAAWTPLAHDSSYEEARRRCAELMAMRKATRSFGPSPSIAGLPKSPLDPGFDTVLKTDYSQKVLLDDARLNKRETLDAVSLIKRFAKFKRSSFPSTRTIAAYHLRDPEDWDQLHRSLRKTHQDAIDIGEVLVSPDRELLESLSPEQRALRQNLVQGRRLRGYYAILRADGDNMGSLLSSIRSESLHREFSLVLGRDFALQVRGVVEQQHQGVLVYSGGDDVLALLPVDTAINCGYELRALFQKTVEQFVRKLGIADIRQGLTVGIAVVHFYESLQAGLDFAHNLETSGKRVPGKDALAIGVRTRSGGDTTFARRWANHPEQDIRNVLVAFDEEQMPRGFPYDMRRLSEEAATLTRALSGEQVADFIAREFNRIWKRKQPAKRKMDLSLPSWVRDAHTLKEFAAILVISHFLTREGTGEEA